MALGARVKAMRELLKMEQSEVCARVPGLSQQALSNLETRDSKTSEFAIRIADALGVSPRWLLDGTGRYDDLDWPFKRVKRDKWDACDDNDRGYIESALRRAIEDCEATRSPNVGNSRAA